MHDWFEELFGFSECSPEVVRANVKIQNDQMLSGANGRQFKIGTLRTPTLGELRASAKTAAAKLPGQLRVTNIIGDAGELHCIPENKGALFQVASQFNLLEMVGPEVTPEQGITGYAFDGTQGPACAIAAAPATLYRNYFAPVGNQLGQTRDHQIDCLQDIGEHLGNENNQLWRMSNGYALDCPNGLVTINQQLGQLSEDGLDALRQKLRIGIHTGIEVTLHDAPAGQIVSQAYCSALPVGYSNSPAAEWEAFARLILDATYEATVAAAIINATQHGTNKVLLTKIGGGVFSNDLRWIYGAMERAFKKYESVGLDVFIVHFGHIDQEAVDLAGRWNGRA